MELLNGFILVKVDEEIKATASGILLTEGSMRLPQSGVVEGVAKGITDVKVGDKVVFLRYAAIDGIDKSTRLCTLDQIIGVYDAKASA